MNNPLCSFIDLEGVLVPEMWPHLAGVFGIDELRATTREIPDYRCLMDQRLAALACHRVALADVCRAVETLAPFEGAVDFLRELKKRGRVVIVTDSFDPMNRHFLADLPADDILCHSFQTGAEGRIERMGFWNGLAGKHLCFETVDHSQVRTFAMGDALNDLTMIRAASIGILFQPSPTTQAAARDLHSVNTYTDALAVLDG